MDSQGKLVKEFDAKSHTLDVSQLGTGVYILQMKTENEILNKKIILE